MYPAPGAWRLNTEHAKYTSRSEEPGLVAATLLESKDIHIGSNLCKISLVGWSRGDVVIMHHDISVTELRTRIIRVRDNRESTVMSRVSLVTYMYDAPQELISSRVSRERKFGFPAQAGLHLGPQGRHRHGREF